MGYRRSRTFPFTQRDLLPQFSRHHSRLWRHLPGVRPIRPPLGRGSQQEHDRWRHKDHRRQQDRPLPRRQPRRGQRRRGGDRGPVHRDVRQGQRQRQRDLRADIPGDPEEGQGEAQPEPGRGERSDIGGGVGGLGILGKEEMQYLIDGNNI